MDPAQVIGEFGVDDRLPVEAIRVAQGDREAMVPGFTKTYGVKLLVCYEVFDDIDAAIHRETRLKKYKRQWKLNLIEQRNPDWRDLSGELS